MNIARYIEPADRVKAAELAVEMGDWVYGLAPWQVIGHLTFAWEASVWSAERCHLKFMKREMRGVSHFYALEQNPGQTVFMSMRCGVSSASLESAKLPG